MVDKTIISVIKCTRGHTRSCRFVRSVRDSCRRAVCVRFSFYVCTVQFNRTLNYRYVYFPYRVQENTPARFKTDCFRDGPAASVRSAKEGICVVENGRRPGIDVFVGREPFGKNEGQMIFRKSHRTFAGDNCFVFCASLKQKRLCTRTTLSDGM